MAAGNCLVTNIPYNNLFCVQQNKQKVWNNLRVSKLLSGELSVRKCLHSSVFDHVKIVSINSISWASQFSKLCVSVTCFSAPAKACVLWSVNEKKKCSENVYIPKYCEYGYTN